MKKNRLFLSLALGLILTSRISAQASSGLDLSTRCVGVPPTHATVDSVARWIENPLDQKLTIAVTNLYADATNYLEIIIDGQHVIFYGAGVDDLGHYIPTNYPPVTVNAVLRREYPMSVMCPNSGPQGSPLFKWEDFNSPDNFISDLTNGVYSPDVSSFIWSNFTAQAQDIFTNTDPLLVDMRQTNLMFEMNRIITTMSFYTNIIFAGFTNSDPIPDIIAQNPTGQQLWYLNRLLLQGAINLYANNTHDNSGSAQITFGVKTPPELKIKKNQSAPNYTVLLNRDSSSDGVLNLANLGTGYASTNNSTIEILKDKFGHLGLGDGCDDATKAPGQGTWLSMGPGCTQDTNRISLEWSVSLGRTFDGLAAGRLAFSQPGLTRDSYTPYAVYYKGSMTNLYAEMPLGTTDNPFVPTNLYASIILVTTNVPYLNTNSAGQVYTNYDSLLRQVKSCQTFVDILTPDTNQTVLNFYMASQVTTNQDSTGLYTNFSGSPFVVWTIKNPSPATVTNLLIVENRLGGGGSTNYLVKSTTGGGVSWILTQGTGPETRLETRTVSFLGSPVSDRVEIDTISSSGTPAYQCQETYHFYPWGSELAQTSIPNSPSNLVTTYNYYTNIDGSDPDDPAGYGYGQLKQIIYPDSYWEKRLYNVGWDSYSGGFILCEVLHPYFNGANGGAVSPDQANLNNCAVEAVERWVGTPITERYIEEYDHGDLRGQLYNGSSDNGQYIHSFSSRSPDDIFGYQNPANDFNDTFDYPGYAPLGLSGHSHEVVSSCLDQRFYYDFGIFDNSANVFTKNAENHLYTWGGITNGYPDHMQTEIDCHYNYWVNDDFLFDASTFYKQGDILGYSPWLLQDYYTEMDGHPLESIGGCFQPYATRKHTKIYHFGNLVQAEEYVYTSGGMDGEPSFNLLNKIRCYIDSLGHVTNAVRIDPVTSQLQPLYTADYRGNSSCDGGLLLSETDQTGQKTSYTYDSLQRVKIITIKGYGNQPDKIVTYAYDANGQVVSEITVAGALSLNQTWAYDSATRVTNHVDQSGVATQVAYGADGLTTTTTYPGGIQMIQQNAQDRFPASVQGSGVVSKFYEHDSIAIPQLLGALDPSAPYGILRKQTTHLGYQNSQRWTCQGTDINGNNVWQEQPIAAGVANTKWMARLYESHLPMIEAVNNGGGGWPQLYTEYNYGFSGEQCLENTYTSSSTDNTGRTIGQIQQTISINGNNYQATTNVIYLTDGSTDRTIQRIHLEQLNGFTGNEMARTIDYDADTNETISVTYIDRANNKLTTVTSKPNTSSLNATNVYQNGLPVSSSTLSVARPTLYFYDALGRTNRIENPLGYSAYINYDLATGWVSSRTDFTGQSTSYQYYNTNEANAGKLKCQTSASGKKTYYAYTTRGELYRTWGDVPYPAEYRYGEYGDLTNLITYRGGTGWTGSTWPASPGTGDNTYLQYDEASGALLKKIDAQGSFVSYSYSTNTGQLLTRSWGRTTSVTNEDNSVSTVSVTVTNSYNGFGDLTAQKYNDGTPNVYFNNYNRAGQPREIVDGSGTNELTYDHASRMIAAAYITGPLAGITVSNHFNPYFGRDAVAVLGVSSALEDDFTYETTSGRLSSVGSGPFLASYGYVPNSDLLQTTTCSSNGATVLTTTRTWDYGMRLRSIANVVGSTPVTSHAYQYDALNRRTKATLEDGSFWQYGYDDRDELTSAKRNWATAPAFVAGQQFSYAYDNIGNRNTAGFGGDTNGANLRTISYTNNSLNQYIGISTPGFENIIGAALATNSVTVNGGLADRKGEYFHLEISVANTNQPVWQNVTNIAGTFTNKGGLVFPANGQTLAYDADGNLSFDGIWSYQWDGENRLVAMWMTNGIANLSTTNRLRLDFAYDYLGRRVQKIVSVWNVATNDFVPSITNQFVYDGWNLLAVVNPQSSILQSFMWGKDLSGTMNRAGGVGGLLLVCISGTNCFTAYDGNGNVTALINALDKSLSARYEYNPYGQLIRETGIFAQQNPFRYSTKFWDEESGLIYYNFRFYSPNLGKWISRDPTIDQVFLHLYLFCHNNPIGRFDIDGRTDWLLVSTGLLHMIGGAAEAGAAGLAEFFSAGVATPVAVLGVVGGGLTFAHGLVELLEGATTTGDVSGNREDALGMPDSIGGWSGLAIGGMTGKAVGNFVEQTINMIGAADKLVGEQLTKILAAEFATQLAELLESEFDVLDSVTGK